MSFTRIALAVAAFTTSGLAPAHQIWIEQPQGRTGAVVRFGEFGENLREASPGLLDTFGQPTATLLAAGGEQHAQPRKAADGLVLPFAASPGESIVAEDAAYPLSTWTQEGKQTTSWYWPAARLITSFAPQNPKLVLDLVPTGKPGEFRLFFKGQPHAKSKVSLVTQSGWTKQATTDDQGLVAFDMPWRGPYIAEVSIDERRAGERPGAAGPQQYDAISYVTTLSYVKRDGVAPVPAGPAAKPKQ